MASDYSLVEDRSTRKPGSTDPGFFRALVVSAFTQMSRDTLLTALSAAPKHRPFVTMWSDDAETSVTFGQFIDQARAQAATFRAHGLAKGDTVILILPQGI